MALTSKMTQRGQITIPQEIREALNLTAESIVQFVLEEEKITIQPMALIPADQAWFWTEENQRKMREAEDDLAHGRYKDFNSAKDLIEDLHRAVKSKKTR